MKITPTLNFGGTCREAIHLYEKAFQGKIACLITYREANDPAYMPLLDDEQKEYIYHAELLLGDQRIIMSDHVDIEFSVWFFYLYYPAHLFLIGIIRVLIGNGSIFP